MMAKILFLLFVSLGQSQMGPDARELCLQNVDRLQQIINLSADCHWVASAQDSPESPPTFYNTLTGHCQGTFECVSPFPEVDRTYRIPNAFCRMNRPPPGNVCDEMTMDCKNSFVDRERNQCNSLSLPNP